MYQNPSDMAGVGDSGAYRAVPGVEGWVIPVCSFPGDESEASDAAKCVPHPWVSPVPCCLRLRLTLHITDIWKRSSFRRGQLQARCEKSVEGRVIGKLPSDRVVKS